MRVVQVVVEPVDDNPPYNQGLQGQWVAEPAEFPGLGVGEGVNADLRKLIALVDVTPGMSTKQLAAAIGKGHSTVERYLKTLRENRLIEFRGAPRTVGIIFFDFKENCKNCAVLIWESRHLLWVKDFFQCFGILISI